MAAVAVKLLLGLVALLLTLVAGKGIHFGKELVFARWNASRTILQFFSTFTALVFSGRGRKCLVNYTERFSQFEYNTLGTPLVNHKK